jgi:hypothetical protein
VCPGPWSAFVYVLIVVLISYCHIVINTHDTLILYEYTNFVRLIYWLFLSILIFYELSQIDLLVYLKILSHALLYYTNTNTTHDILILLMIH